MENTENSLIYTYVFSIPASLGKYLPPASGGPQRRRFEQIARNSLIPLR